MLNVLLRGHLDWFTIVANLAVLCVVVFPARGMAQAFVAYKLGDPTAKYNGRLSMNPLAHMDKYGIVVLFLCGLGFIKPIPINSRNFRNPRRDMILTILAGPVMGRHAGRGPVPRGSPVCHERRQREQALADSGVYVR